MDDVHEVQVTALLYGFLKQGMGLLLRHGSKVPGIIRELSKDNSMQQRLVSEYLKLGHAVEDALQAKTAEEKTQKVNALPSAVNVCFGQFGWLFLTLHHRARGLPEPAMLEFLVPPQKPQRPKATLLMSPWFVLGLCVFLYVVVEQWREWQPAIFT